MITTQAKTVGRKIEGTARCMAAGSSSVGCMGSETPYVVLKLDGETYRWQSIGVDEYEIGQGDAVGITAYARANNHLYRVTIKSVSKL